jgi:hypothetical protein
MSKRSRCIDCCSEFNDEDLIKSKASCCPVCGTLSLPVSVDKDVNITINWNELRILTMWASRWAEQDGFNESSKISLHKIIKRLSKYRPDGSPALTLVEEFKELQEKYPNASLISDGEEIIGPKYIGELGYEK